jgi:sporulation protein YlmC with PRC-barrel domain
MARVGIVHDLLDMQLVDRNGEKMGRVDGVTLELTGGPPRVAELLVGGSVQAERVGGWAVRLLRALARLCRVQPVVTRIPFAVVQEISDTIVLDVEAHATTALRTEHWLDRIICRIPGAAASDGKAEK